MTLLNTTNIAIVIVLTLAIYHFVLYPLLVSSLSKIPAAHPFAPLSQLWITYVRKSGCENRTVHAAHQRLGPIIRLGPNEISINCVDGGIRTVSLSTLPTH